MTSSTSSGAPDRCKLCPSWIKSHHERYLLTPDRWGDPDPRPKTLFGCFLGLLMLAALSIYAVVVYKQYSDILPEEFSQILWSAADGPYPMKISCFAERCWVSVDFDVEAVGGQSKKCAMALPSAQSGKCLDLARGQSMTIQHCYTQMPTDGIRMHFAGSSMWSTLEGQPTAGLVDGELGNLFGFTIDSDMLGPEADTPVMPMQTPVRAGITQLNYVKTLNGTIDPGEPGSVRHEWFAQLLSPEASDSDFLGDPCDTVVSSWGSSTRRISLRMSPSFTVVNVIPPPDFLSHLFGEVGGAMGSMDGIILIVVLVYLQVVNRSSKEDAPADTYGPSGQEVPSSPATPPDCQTVPASASDTPLVAAVGRIRTRTMHARVEDSHCFKPS